MLCFQCPPFWVVSSNIEQCFSPDFWYQNIQMLFEGINTYFSTSLLKLLLDTGDLYHNVQTGGKLSEKWMITRNYLFVETLLGMVEREVR